MKAPVVEAKADVVAAERVAVGVSDVKPAADEAEPGEPYVTGVLGSTRIVPGPSGVSDVRQIAPASSTRYVGSPLPRPCTPSVTRTSTANGASQSSSTIGSPIRSTHEPHAKTPASPEPGNPPHPRVPVPMPRLAGRQPQARNADEPLPAGLAESGWGHDRRMGRKWFMVRMGVTGGWGMRRGRGVRRGWGVRCGWDAGADGVRNVVGVVPPSVSRQARSE